MGMFNSSKKAKSDIKSVVKSNDEILIVHYSYANVPNLSGDIFPIITTIVVRSLDDKIYECYGLHIEADLIGISKSEMKDIYSDLELSMLEKFMAFVRLHNSSYWLNWDMKNITFGFQAIKHRYSKLTGGNNIGFIDIPAYRKKDLDVLLSELYGDNYSVEPDKLLDILKCNNFDTHSYMTSNTESIEFNNLNFNSVLDSVKTKVEAISFLFEKIASNKIKVPHKNTYSKFVDIVTHPVMAFIGWLATIIGVILGIMAL